MAPLFKKILVANRSEIAVRVMDACRTLGIPTVAVYSEADVGAKHRLRADEAIPIGPAPPRESYLDIEKILQAAKATGADAIHPGYGFLSENALFARRCADEGITFIGPPPDVIQLLGNKVDSRVAMAKAGVPLIPGMKTASDDLAEYERAADSAGYPVLIKAAGGGGGKGMRVVHEKRELASAIDAARREALNAFNDATVYLEKYLINPRHVEFQILSDTQGNHIHLFERECSIQRRHQKIIEETPSTALSPELRERMGAAAVEVARTAGYVNAGTVEFLVDESGRFYFLEVNTRLQVEHPITEMVTGVDLVVEQIRIAAGLPISDSARTAAQRGHAIECRIYAENGENGFLPSTGRILYYAEPAGPGIRVDSGIMAGSEITINYDPIMAKLIVHASSRAIAIERMIHALHDYKILGVSNAKRFMVEVLSHDAFRSGRTYTNFIDTHMQERTPLPETINKLAVAAASAATTEPTGKGSKGGRVALLTPWQSEGIWQVGDSIR